MTIERIRRRRFWAAIPPWLIIGAVVILVPLFILMTLENINRQTEQTTRLLAEKGAALIRSFEFNHTPRSFEFPGTDAPLLARLKELALKCWRLFDLRGYARVDFRVDREGRPWILEVNANPCLSPDAGFHATTLQAGLNFTEVLRRIIADIRRGNN